MTILGYRLLMRNKNEPIRMVEVTCPLPLAVSGQLMVMTRQVTDPLKTIHSSKLIKPLLEKIGPLGTEFPDSQTVAVGTLPQSLILK